MKQYPRIRYMLSRYIRKRKEVCIVSYFLHTYEEAMARKKRDNDLILHPRIIGLNLKNPTLSEKEKC